MIWILRQKKQKIISRKTFSTWWIMQFLEKPWKMGEKNRDIKLLTTERRRNYLVSEPNSHTTMFFTENLLAREIRKTWLLMKKPVYLDLSILGLRKTEMYEFWYDYLKPRYSEYAKLCYMDTESFTVHVKTDNIYKGVAEDIETRFDTLILKIDRPLPKGKKSNWINKTWIRWTNDKTIHWINSKNI